MRGFPFPACALGLSLLACGVAEPPQAQETATTQQPDRDVCQGPVGTTPRATLGTGMLTPSPLGSGDHVAYEAGPQGGHHVWVSVVTRGIRQAGTLTTFEAVDITVPEQPVLLARRTVPFVLNPDVDGACVLAGLRLQLDEDNRVDVTTLVGHTLRLGVRLEDETGGSAQDQCDVVLDAPAPADGGAGTP